MEQAIFVEWVGTATGVVGALLLAGKFRYSALGWIFFLVSNFFWIAFSLLNGHMGQLTQQVVFTFTSLLGVYRWIVEPFLEERRAAVPVDVGIGRRIFERL